MSEQGVVGLDRADKLLAQLYKAMAHPVRLYLLAVLSRQEVCVCHLTCLLRRPQPYISQQLSVLRDAGLVIDRREGQTIYYRVADPAVLDWMALSREILARQGVLEAAPAEIVETLDECPCPRCSLTRGE